MKPGEELTKEEIKKCEIFVDLLHKQAVKLICYDFDLTLSCVHTWGEKVVPNQTRPVFQLIKELAFEKGIKICITTQHPMVEAVKKEVSRALDMPEDEVIVRSPENTEPEEQFGFFFKGKTILIEAAWKDIFPDKDVDFMKTILIDDDYQNVMKCEKHNCPAVWFNPQAPNLDFFLNKVSNPKRFKKLFFAKDEDSTDI